MINPITISNFKSGCLVIISLAWFFASDAIGEDERSGESITELPELVTETQPFLFQKGVASSLSFIDTEKLDRSGLDSISQLSAQSPNLNISNNSLRSFGDVYTIRGIGNTAFFSDPGVVLYIDDAPFGNAFAYALDLYDVEELEIRRGPQGTFFGRNSEAGVIEVRTRQPDNTLRTSAAAIFGNYDRQEYRVSFSGPLVSDRLFISLNGGYAQHDGFVHNTFLNKNTDTRDSWIGRMALRWVPSEEWAISFGLNGEVFDDGDQRIVSLNGDPFQVSSDFEGSTQIDRNTQSFKAARSFDWGVITSITTRQDWSLNPNTLDLDLSSDPFFTSTITQFQDLWTEELRMESKESDESTWHWRTGLFFLDSETKGDSVRTFFGAPERSVYTIKESNYAFFGSVIHKLFDDFKIVGGIRYDYSEKSIDRVKASVQGQNLEVIRDVDDSNFVPTLGFSYQLTKELNIYGSTGLGFKSGGFSAFSDDPIISQYNTETVWSNEFGIKMLAFNENLQLSLSAFYNDIDDYQVERSFTLTDYIIVNAPKSHSSGIELEMVSNPVEPLEIGVTFGYTNFEFDEYLDPFSGNDFKGKRAPFTPEFTLNISALYEHKNGFFAWIQFNALGDIYFDEANTPRYRQSDYGLLNARFGYQRDWFSVVLFGRNLTDTNYFTNKIIDLDAGVPGEPQTFGFKTSISF